MRLTGEAREGGDRKKNDLNEDKFQQQHKIKQQLIEKTAVKETSTTLNQHKHSNLAIPNVEIDFINKKLPKELIIRIFSHLDIISLCRCAQVSKLSF